MSTADSDLSLTSSNYPLYVSVFDAADAERPPPEDHQPLSVRFPSDWTDGPVALMRADCERITPEVLDQIADAVAAKLRPAPTVWPEGSPRLWLGEPAVLTLPRSP
jgi:hypothetical protein